VTINVQYIHHLSTEENSHEYRVRKARRARRRLLAVFFAFVFFPKPAANELERGNAETHIICVSFAALSQNVT
jgi:hypothetical protein